MNKHYAFPFNCAEMKNHNMFLLRHIKFPFSRDEFEIHFNIFYFGLCCLYAYCKSAQHEKTHIQFDAFIVNFTIMTFKINIQKLQANP